MGPLRIGLVGYGRFGQLHAKAMAEVPGIELKAVCVGNRASARGVRVGGVEVYWDFDEFLKKGGIDAVDIVSPNYLHAKHTAAALTRGLHVFVEKPVTTNLADAKMVLEDSRKSKRVVQVGHQYRYEPFWKELRRVIGSGMISNPTFAKVESWRGPFRQGSGGWRYDGPRVGHQLLEEAVHYFDLAVWFFGMPSRVSGFTDSSSSWKAGVFGTAVVVFDYPDGMKFMLVDTLNGLMGHTNVSVTGGGAVMGEMQAELDGSTSSWVRAMGKDGTFSSAEPRPLEEVEGIRLEMQDFVNSVRDGSKPAVTIEDGYNAVVVDLAAIQSIGDGKTVDLDDFLGK